MTTSLPGINGVLDGILSPKAKPPAAPRITPHAQKTASLMPEATATERSPVTSRTGARRGRPMGSSTPKRPPREKVTLLLGENLIAEYRDWSWDVRCHLSALVERALTEYQGRFRKPRCD